MIKKEHFLLILLLTFVILHTNAQQVIFGTNNYIEYQVGTLPLVISVPHGGDLEPSTIPDRTCNNPVYATDEFTIETALEIKSKLFELTGCYPHLIISHLDRRKLDPNRNLADGACENAEAQLAWNEFHNFISDARNTANQEHNFQTFFVDLHGHGNPIQRIELGYLLYDDELELTDNTLNTLEFLNYSSIKNLAINNANNYTHAELLRGPYAFGTFLANNNYPAVPSQNIPFPGTTSNYYSGGYIIANHTCFHPNAPINGLQMELNYDNIRNTPANRTAFANGFALSILDFFTTHFNVSLIGCAPLSSWNTEIEESISIYPNPAQQGDIIRLISPENMEFEYHVCNAMGQEIVSDLLKPNQTIKSADFLPGVYFIKFASTTTNESFIKKVIIH